MGSWIVEPNVLGGWDARLQTAEEPAYRTSERETAEAWARAMTDGGDEVLVRDGHGSVLTRFVDPRPRISVVAHEVPPVARRPVAPRPVPPRPVPPVARLEPPRHDAAPGGPPRPAEERQSLVQRLDSEGEKINTWLDLGLPVAAALFAGGFTAEFLALGTNWIAIFFGTLSWSAGIAATTYFLTAHKLRDTQAIGAAVGSMLAALFVAYLLGTGVLDVVTPFMETSGYPWLRVLLSFAIAAVLAYGFWGAVLSAAIGWWLGYRLARHFPGT